MSCHDLPRLPLQSRLGRIFALHAQMHRAEHATTPEEEFRTVSPHFARAFQAAAMASLRWPADQDSGAPR